MCVAMINYISFTIAEMTTTRKANFSSEEVDILVEEVGKRKEVLFAKFSAVITNQRKKMEWQEIADRMNVVSKQVRDQKDVKKKWQDLSSSSKKKESCRRREMNKTGGGEAEYENVSTMEQKVIAVIGEEAVEGIVGGFDVGLEEICELRNEQVDEVLKVKEEIKFVVDEKVRDVVKEGLGGKSGKRKVGTERLIEIEEEKWL